MPTRIQEPVDIYAFPSSINHHDEGKEITLGDLHGNVMNLIFMLIKEGIVTHINSDDYQKLVTIYRTPTEQVTPDNIDEFNALLNKMVFKPNVSLRFIGDELADRGQNDYYTLKLLEKLYEKNVAFEILISNHGMEFLIASESEGFSFDVQSKLTGEFCLSFDNLKKFLEKKWVTKDEIIRITETIYKPRLRVLSYVLNKDHSEIVIHSHAPIGLNTIEMLASFFDVDYLDDRACLLAQTINDINEGFHGWVQSKSVHKIYPREGQFQEFNLVKASVLYVTSNRTYMDLIRPPVHTNGYTIYYVHGHDMDDPVSNHVFNLDNNLGKWDLGHCNDYFVLYTDIEPMDSTLVFHNIPQRSMGELPAKPLSLSMHRFFSPPPGTPLIQEIETKEEKTVLS